MYNFAVKFVLVLGARLCCLINILFTNKWCANYYKKKLKSWWNWCLLSFSTITFITIYLVYLFICLFVCLPGDYLFCWEERGKSLSEGKESIWKQMSFYGIVDWEHSGFQTPIKQDWTLCLLLYFLKNSVQRHAPTHYSIHIPYTIPNYKDPTHKQETRIITCV